jgi:Fatty-acid desaturase
VGAVHRKHHKFTDRTGDPHSPKVLGFWRIQLFNVYYYVREAKNLDTIRTFAPDLPEDRWDRAIFSWGRTGLATGIALLCLVLGVWPGLIVAFTHAALYVFVLAPLINGLGHWRGAQNFENTAYNSRLLALVTGRGEPAQQSSCASARPEVQHATVRVRSVVDGDPVPRAAEAGGDRRGHPSGSHARLPDTPRAVMARAEPTPAELASG